jgi:hypothetical protein
MATLIRIFALKKVHLRDLITNSKNSIESNQYVKEPSFFDDI